MVFAARPVPANEELASARRRGTVSYGLVEALLVAPWQYQNRFESLGRLLLRPKCLHRFYFFEHLWFRWSQQHSYFLNPTRRYCPGFDHGLNQYRKAHLRGT